MRGLVLSPQWGRSPGRQQTEPAALPSPSPHEPHEPPASARLSLAHPCPAEACVGVPRAHSPHALCILADSVSLQVLVIPPYSTLTSQAQSSLLPFVVLLALFISLMIKKYFIRDAVTCSSNHIFFPHV